MVRGIPDILQWFSNSGKPYWRIYAHKGITSGNFVLQSPQHEGQSHGDAYQDLQSKIRVMTRGCFTMVAYETPDRLPAKGYQFTDIEITQGDANTGAVAAINGPTAITEVEITSRIDSAVKSALAAYKTEQELADLKKKVGELEKENKNLEKSVNEPWNKVVNALAPHSDKIIAGIFPNTPAAQVAGLPAPDPGPEENTVVEGTTALTADQQEVLSEFVSTMAANDPDWENTLRRLTKAIQDKPSMIAMVKNFI